MADVEKVIKGLECCANPYFDVCINKECPYAPKSRKLFTDCQLILMNDAIELLKDQKERIYILEERIAIMGGCE